MTINTARGVLINDTDEDEDELTATLVGGGPGHGTVTLHGSGSFTFMPASSYTGSDSFQYTVSDGIASSTATVTLNIHSSNDAPSVSDDYYDVHHDRVLLVPPGGVLLNDSDSDYDPLTAALVANSGPDHGTLTFNSDGSFIYIPDEEYLGTDSFQYTASDGLADSTATVTITVANLHVPVANDDTYTISHDHDLIVGSLGVLENDTDEDGDSLTVTLVADTGPDHGDLTLNEDGTFTYTPDEGYVGSDSFQYTVSDGLDDSTAATVTIDVTNGAPITKNDFFSVLHDTELTVDGTGVLSNDYDPDGDVITAILVTGPAHGDLTVNADGSFSYTPDEDYVGHDSFDYQAEDADLSSETTTVNLWVKATNTAPVAGNDTYSVAHDRELVLFDPNAGLLANDTDPDADPLMVVIATGPFHGTVNLWLDGSFAYSPDNGYVGSDSFTYTLSDGTTTDAAQVTLTITNATPVAGDDSYRLKPGQVLDVDADWGVLVNDADPDNDPLTATLGTGPGHGTVTFNGNGSFTYTPESNFTGTDSFTYTASDSITTHAATVTLLVSNDTPTTNPDRYSVHPSATTEVDVWEGVLHNDADADDTIAATVVAGPSHGSLTLSANGSFSYTPNGSFSGSDTFTYYASDGVANSGTTTVVLVAEPVAHDDSYSSIQHSRPFEVGADQGVLENDDNASGGSMEAVLVANATHGEVSLNSDGSFTYIPDAGYVGSDTFSYHSQVGACPGHRGGDRQTVLDPGARSPRRAIAAAPTCPARLRQRRANR